MFKKVIIVGAILIATMISYFLITIVVPFLSDLVSTTNITITASSNFSNYPGTQAVILSTPLYIYFVPAIFAIILIVIVLKQPTR